MDMAELNGNYDSLKGNGEAIISKIREFLMKDSKNVRYKVVSPLSQPYQLDFMAFDILFRVRVELLSNCESEETSLGHVRFYRRDYEACDGETTFLAFPILKGKMHGKQHEIMFRYIGSKFQIDISESDAKHINMSEFSTFFERRFPDAVADAAIPIPLHLIGA